MKFILMFLFMFGIKTAAGQNFHVYLDCDRCDEDYQKRELAWVEFVRDPDAADIHVWVVSQGNSSGGRQYTFRFIDKNSSEETEITYTSENTQTRLEVQADISTVLTGGLLPHVLKQGITPDLQAREEEQVRTTETMRAADPWNFWVFEVRAGGWFNREQQRRDLELDGDLRINRTTEKSRLRMRLEYDYESNTIFQDDGDVRSILNTASWEASHVWSLGPNWSLGIFSQLFTNSVVNTDLGLQLNPALEFNVYPYTESHIREFTFAYYVGPFYRDYGEETIFGETEEWLIGEQLSVDYRLNRPWGRLSLELDAFHYFEDFDKNRLSLEAGVDIRLARGLFAGVDTEYSLIHDQIYLPRGDVPLEDVLLRRRALATTFEFSARVGISYTFGSVYNSIVNTRL